jgi:hypothetical protein
MWRRERDSNPRKPFGFNGFQDRRLKPLGHLSSSYFFRIVSTPSMYGRSAAGTTTEPSSCW